MDRYFKANAVLSIFAKNYMELKKGLPIRPSEMGVLNIITQTEGLHTPVALAEMLGVSKSMITAHITSLEKKGYIVKSPSEQDKRAYYILPTDKALELVKTAKTDLNAQFDRLASAMGQEEFDTLVRLAEEANIILEDKGE